MQEEEEVKEKRKGKRKRRGKKLTEKEVGERKNVFTERLRHFGVRVYLRSSVRSYPSTKRFSSGKISVKNFPLGVKEVCFQWEQSTRRLYFYFTSDTGVNMFYDIKMFPQMEPLILIKKGLNFNKNVLTIEEKSSIHITWYYWSRLFTSRSSFPPFSDTPYCERPTVQSGVTFCAPLILFTAYLLFRSSYH